jgi:probable phosphoglycerate mutase
VRFSIVLLFSTLLLIPAVPHAVGAQQESVIFLVRHAERADDGDMNPAMAMDPQMREDPPLSEAGRIRASLLAEMLRDAGITHIHSTDYRRTRETAQPTSAATGVEAAIYDPSDLDAFAVELRSAPGRHLVVGHSNTTHSLVEALGGDPGLSIEALEYDRLYLVTVDEGVARTVLLRFGDPFIASGHPKP